MAEHVCRPEVEAMIASSPRMALALAEYKTFVPYIFTITGTFTAAGTPGPSTNNNANPANIDQDLLILGVDVDIQTPNFVAGNVMKPQADANYNQTSGIQTALRIQGFAERATPYFPLKALPTLGVAMMSAGAPGGAPLTMGAFQRPWVLLADQELWQDFSVTTALPSAGTTITCTYTCSTVYPAKFCQDQGKALDLLEAKGYCVDSARKQFCS